MSHASGTVVDSSVLLDVFTMDTAWGDWSQMQLTRAAQRGALILNAVVVAEIAPRFERIETLRAALPSMAVVEEIPLAAAFLAGHAHANYRRAGGPREAGRSSGDGACPCSSESRCIHGRIRRRAEAS